MKLLYFRQLTKDEVGEIAEIMLKEVFTRISEKGIQLEVTARFKAHLIDEGYQSNLWCSTIKKSSNETS